MSKNRRPFSNVEGNWNNKAELWLYEQGYFENSESKQAEENGSERGEIVRQEHNTTNTT